MIATQKKINEKMDKEEEIRATKELQKIEGPGVRARLMTNVLSNQDIADLRDYKMKKVNGEYIRVKKESPPPVDYKKLDDRRRAEELAEKFKEEHFN